jgi:hypothetical protein
MAQCDGERPLCHHCQRLGIKCQYRIEPSETRFMALKRRRDEAEYELSILREFFSLVKQWPEAEWPGLLQRIKAHPEDISSLVDSIKSYILSRQPGSVRSDANGVSACSLPPISSILHPYLEPRTRGGPLEEAAQCLSKFDTKV